MADYDSDSSAGEYTETTVLLGYASKEADDDTISRLGGRPEWLDPEKPASVSLAKCKVCKGLMVLLLQLNGELPERFPNHDRRIYVFGCRRNTCRRKDGSIRAIRGVRVWKERENEGSSAIASVEQSSPKNERTEATEQPQAPKKGLGDSLFGSSTFGSPSASGNPFSTSGKAPAGNPFATQAAKPEAPQPTPSKLAKTFAQTLSLNAPMSTPPPAAEPWPQASEQPAPYPLLYLADADYETLDPTPAELPANARIEAADAPEPSALDREAFESSMDSTFQKFADRLSQNPEQVIRYEYGGTPLLYSKMDRVGDMLSKGNIPRCPNCGGRRTFEVQMTPHAIAELEAEDLSLEGMEWGTIIVCVCESDCLQSGQSLGGTGYLEEFVGVQWEELAKNK